MKKIIGFLIIIIFLFAACQKDEVLQPDKVVNVELYGAYNGTFKTSGSYQAGDLKVQFYDKDTLNYLVNVNVNGLDHFTKVQTILDLNFVGRIYFNAFRVNQNDVVKISVKNVNDTYNSYVVMNIFDNPYTKTRLELKQQFTEFIIK